jgi:hypothetical protein
VEPEAIGEILTQVPPHVPVAANSITEHDRCIGTALTP